MKYIKLGKIVNTHGIKGELRIISDFRYKDKVFKKDMLVYIGKDKIKETINSYRPHKQFDMITLVGYTNINEVLKYKGLNIFVDKEDIILNDNNYLDEDLIDLDVFCENNLVGKLVRIEKYPHQDLFVVKNDVKEYLIPYVSDIIESINLNEQKITIKNIKGLIE